jgi:hypothetical protein
VPAHQRLKPGRESLPDYTGCFVSLPAIGRTQVLDDHRERTYRAHDRSSALVTVESTVFKCDEQRISTLVILINKNTHCTEERRLTKELFPPEPTQPRMHASAAICVSLRTEREIVRQRAAVC